MADELIKLYAKREAAQGYAFGPDTDWQNDFERRFPTRNRRPAALHPWKSRRIWRSPSPMDRLLCGDVGFGKTEVAIRAAFKCDGRQTVRGLVPTTILAWQHYQTFLQEDGGLSGQRWTSSPGFQTPRSRAGAGGAAPREVDIVVGTHRWCRRTSSLRIWACASSTRSSALASSTRKV